MKIHVMYDGVSIQPEEKGGTLKMTIPHEGKNKFLEIQFEREKRDKEEYVLLPASAYNGNRFACLDRPYPPIFHKDEIRLDMPTTVTASVARLNPDGSGKLAVTSGDLSVPCIGVFDAANQKGTLIYSVQQIKGVNIGFTYQEGGISIVIPRKRNDAFPFRQKMDEGLDFEAGEEILLPVKMMEFDCEDLSHFWRVFFENRKCMGLPDEKPDVPAPEVFREIFEKKFNEMNYCEILGAYAVGVYEDTPVENPSRRFQVWQPGWVGGAMSSYPLMKFGSRKSYERALKTLDFLFSTQHESGFFTGIVDENGRAYGDAFELIGDTDWHLARKSADVLYFLFKHFKAIEDAGETVCDRYKEGTRKLADAFVRLWEKYGQFGQFVSHDSGDIIVGGSSSCAIICAGLEKCAAYFGEEKYRKVAEEAGEYYYRMLLKEGCTTGGPGEILSAPDSESAFGLLESMVTLYEETGDQKWLNYACDTAHYCSTWVVAYNYVFPSQSEFGRLGIHTVGSVFANAQNKHSAPGICTLSGDSLYRLYQYSKDPLYLELIQDIAKGCFQYVSREDRPIRAKMEDGYQAMPAGYVNERVNISDWEEGRVGEVFYGSTWAETSVMLTMVELPELLQ